MPIQILFFIFALSNLLLIKIVRFMKHVKISPKNFDSILNESINRIKRACSLRQLDKDEIRLLAEYELCENLGFSINYDNSLLRNRLISYCYGTSTFNK